jgi:hypothetical protein
MKNSLYPKFSSPTQETYFNITSWFNQLSLDKQEKFLMTEEISDSFLLALVTPENYLARLGSDVDLYQQLVAKRSRNSLRVWFVLATQSTRKTLSIISQNHNVPPHILDRLKYRKDEDIVLGLAKNNSTSWETLKEMVSSLKSSNHRKLYVLAVENILRRETISAKQLESLVSMLFTEKKIVPTFSNGWRFNEPLTTLSLLLATSDSLPSSILDMLYKLTVPKFSDLLDNNDVWYINLVERILRHQNFGEQNFQDTFAFLDTLNPVLNDYTWILSALLMNPSCPEEFLAKYCASDSLYIRSLASRHANCPEHAKVLAVLS